MAGDLLAGIEAANGIPSGMLGAVMQTESGGNPKAVSPKGAMGPFQLMPATAKAEGVTNPFDITQAAPAAAKILVDNYKQFGDWNKALAAYNAGAGNIQKAGGVPNFPETKAYVQKVNAKMPIDSSKIQWDDQQSQATPQIDPAQVQWDQPATPQATQQAPAAGPQPTILDQLGRQVGLTARAAGHGIAAGAGALTQGFTRLMGVPDVQDVINGVVDKYTPQPQGALEQGVQGVASQIANPLNYALPAGGMVRGAIGGALGSAIQPTPQGQTPLDSLKQAAVGAATGGLMGGVGKIIAGANLRPAAQALVDQGVTLTPGQALGGTANSLEQKITSIPGLGEAVSGARTSAVKDMNVALGNQVLAPIGDTVTKGTPTRDLVSSVGQKISDQYDQVLPRLTFKVDPQLAQDMAPIMQKVSALPPDTQNAFMSIWQRNIKSQLDPHGTMSGIAFKDADSVIGGEAANFKGSSDAFQRNLGSLLQDTQSVLRNSLERTNPNEPSLGPINQAWRNYTVLRNAGARVNNPESPIMPGQLQAAVKAGDKSVGKGAFARGNANMQGLADNSMAVLGNNVPDSGTAGRGMLGGFPGWRRYRKGRGPSRTGNRSIRNRSGLRYSCRKNGDVSRSGKTS